MRESYKRISIEIDEIMDLITKKAIKDDIFDGIDPDTVVLMVRCLNLMKMSDKFTMACIDAMESQNEKLDRILSKLN